MTIRHNTAKVDPALSAALRRLRTWGYDDGYAGKPAVTVNATYQKAWRDGRKAREAFENDAA